MSQESEMSRSSGVRVRLYRSLLFTVIEFSLVPRRKDEEALVKITLIILWLQADSKILRSKNITSKTLYG
jgi:hypothetical protein